nr:AraC family transcriptional regulator [uncultured Niameybacter sp.]
MLAYTSCKEATTACIVNKYFSIAHLTKEEKTMNMHIHDCYELYYSISGGKQFLIDNKLYTISPGELFVINQYETHHLTQIDQEIHERIVISICPEFLNSLSTNQTDLAYCFTNHPKSFNHKLSLSSEYQKRFLYYVNKILSANDYGGDIIEKCAFQELMLFINTVYSQNIDDTLESTFQYNKQVNDILSYINNNIEHNITIDELANHFYLSTSYICRIFKATTGTTIVKYITARRISIAKTLLANGLNVTDTFLQCGFNDYSNFVRAFTKAVGISPKKYSQLSNS